MTQTGSAAQHDVLLPQGWSEAEAEASPCESCEDERVLDANTKHMCNLHAHLLLTLRNASAAQLDEGRVQTTAAAAAKAAAAPTPKTRGRQMSDVI